MLDDYIINIDNVTIDMINHGIEREGLQGYLNDLLVVLDCSRISGDLRLMQTISYAYNHYISCFMYVLKHNKGLDEYKSKLEDLHKRNLEFEIANPPVYYEKKRKSNKKNTSRNKHKKEETLNGLEKPKKLSVAQIKLKEKLSKLKLNIKLHATNTNV